MTDRHESRDALIEAISLLEAALESTADGILIVDADGRIARYNRRFQELWRIPDEILASGDDDRAIAFVLDQLRDPDAFVEKVRYLYAHPEEESFDVLLFKDGRVFERYSLPRRIDGRPSGRVWSFRDVTRRIAAEAQLRHALKMESLGRLAGGMAHDFNNLLVPIIGCAEMIMERLDAGDVRDDVAQILDAARRAARLTRSILAFSRQQILEFEDVDLSRIVADEEEMIRRLAGERIALATAYAPEPLVVSVDRAQIEQVILNLVVNALDAMPDGGDLRLETSRHDDEDGAWAVLAVIDSGVGIEASVRDKIFEPFFTTKERGQGTGLGLSMVLGIVEQHGGRVDVDSRPGTGTRITVWLPMERPAPRRNRARRRAGDAPRGRGGRPEGSPRRVLVIEDDDSVRMVTGRVLRRRGFEVATARSGEEALHAHAVRAHEFDVVVSDVVMPGIDGPRCVRGLREAGFTGGVVYMTGYNDALDPSQHATDDVTLAKPFTPSELVDAVRRALVSAPVES